MKAVRFESPSLIRVVEIPEPEFDDHELLVRVCACGICASDLHLSQIKSFDLPYPFVPGHEAAGIVVDVGKAVENVKIEDRVVVQPSVPCGICECCRKGYTNLCLNPHSIGLQRSGAFAEYIAVPEQNVYSCGDLPFSAAACTEPLACAMHGLERLNPRRMHDVLIFGASTIGLCFLQLIRNRIAGRLVVVDLHPCRLEAARQLGADHVVLADDAENSVLEFPQPRFDCVVDATGVPAVVETALHRVAPAGSLLMLGSCPKTASFSLRPREIQRNDITLVGSFSFNIEFLHALRMIQQRQVNIDSIVTHHYSLDAFPQAFEQARLGREGIKIQIQPSLE